MADSSFRVRNSLNIEGKASPTLDQPGDIGYNTSSNEFEVRDNAATRSLVTDDGTQTLTNKTIDAASNTLSNIPSSATTLDTETAIDVATSNTDSTVNIGTGTGANTINIGGANTIVNITGSVSNQAVTNLNVSDKLITINNGGAAASGGSSGLEVEEDGVATGYIQTGSDRDTWKFKAPNQNGVVTLTHGASNDDIVLEDATQTLTNKTLTSPALTTPTTDVVTLDGQASAPTNPSAGNYKLYVDDTTQKLTLLDENGVTTAVGAGGGGINYIDNPDAEAGVTGWSAYADAAASRPADGTGGSPTVTITTTSSSPLRGNNSFLITKDAADRQGEGVSYDFTIDSADQAKVLQTRFDYEIASGTYSGGTSSTDSDLIVYLYDVTNGVTIEPSVIKLDGAVSGVKYQYRGEFQTASNSTSYRLIVHVATTSASAYTVKFDNVEVTPNVVSRGAVITEWQQYTPTITHNSGSVTNLNRTAWWRRVGSNLEIMFDMEYTGTGGTWSGFYMSFPSGLVSQTIADENAFNIIGHFQVHDSGSAVFHGNLHVTGGGTKAAFRVAQITTHTGTVPVSTLDMSSTFPMTPASGDDITGYLSVPIQGWGTSQTLSQDGGTRVVAAIINGTPTGTITGSPSLIKYPTTITDTHTGYNASTGLYTVPESGIYEITASAYVPATYATNNAASIFIYKNGSSIFNSNQVAGGSITQLYPTVTGKYSFSAGDTISVYIASGGTTPSLSASGANYLHINKIQGPQQIAATETVAVRAYRSTNQSIASAAATDVVYNTIVRDTHGGLNTSTGIYTVPAPGWYAITASVYIDALTANEVLVISITGSKGTASRFVRAIGTDFIEQVSGLNYYNAGETIKITVDSTSDTSYSVISSSGGSFVSIHRVGI